ncbi:hypothetical protein F2Q68_00033850 [Brassica cretica]|uniref:Uncharacterized protein n=1 Tax=Brassica cretica TaxID=69181 RepID=A0A8S9H6J7_BRACR|nr:hypothetical protein F2Q68_00033850 [Brassica cretica]
MHRPTCQTGELDRTRRPTRPFGELDGASRPTRPFGELDRTRRPTRPFGVVDRASRPTRPFHELDRTSRPTRPFGELDKLACLHLILVAPSFKIGPNLLLFHLDRSHHSNFTIYKPQELVFSYEVRIDRIKWQRLTKHRELSPLYEKFELSSESTSFRKHSLSINRKNA